MRSDFLCASPLADAGLGFEQNDQVRNECSLSKRKGWITNSSNRSMTHGCEVKLDHQQNMEHRSDRATTKSQMSPDEVLSAP